VRADAVIELVRGERKLRRLLEQPLRKPNASLGRDALLDVLREAHMLVAAQARPTTRPPTATIGSGAIPTCSRRGRAKFDLQAASK